MQAAVHGRGAVHGRPRRADPGYSFNLDGAAIYLSLATLYIAQATDTSLSLGQQLGLLAVMLLTSKGAAGVAGGGFIANPISAVGSAALMLEHLGLPDQAARLHKAIEATTGAGILTRDVGGTATTEDVVKALIDALDA